MRPLQASVKWRPTPGAPLSKGERTTLWYLAQGHTYRSAARARGIGVDGIRTQVRSILGKTGSTSTAQAVFVALNSGVIGQYLDCGTRNAYLRHRKRGETTCLACRLANAEHSRAQRAGDLRKKEHG